MNFLAFEKAMELFLAVKDRRWDLANILVDELKGILDTYKRSC